MEVTEEDKKRVELLLKSLSQESCGLQLIMLVLIQVFLK